MIDVVAEPIICRNCKGENPPHSRYCVHCSFSLAWESDTKPEPSTSTSRAPTATEGSPGESEPASSVSASSYQVPDETRSLRPVTPGTMGRRGWIAVAIAIAVVAVASVIIIATRGTGSGSPGFGEPPADASASGEVAGTVVNGGGVNVRTAPQGMKVGHLASGLEITARCQSEVNGLVWLKLATPAQRAGRWIVRDLRPVGGHLVVELADGDPATCS